MKYRYSTRDAILIALLAAAAGFGFGYFHGVVSVAGTNTADTCSLNATPGGVRTCP